MVWVINKVLWMAADVGQIRPAVRVYLHTRFFTALNCVERFSTSIKPKTENKAEWLARKEGIDARLEVFNQAWQITPWRACLAGQPLEAAAVQVHRQVTPLTPPLLPYTFAGSLAPRIPPLRRRMNG